MYITDATTKDFFFCYNKELGAYLQSKGHNMLTLALNSKTQTPFSMFAKCPELNVSINDYNQR